jgi:hypothetical protein
MKNLRIALTFFLIAGIVVTSVQTVPAQSPGGRHVFEKMELLEYDGKRTWETTVNVRFSDDTIEIESASRGGTIRRFKYTDIRALEYSYTKNPRWKTGLGLGAAALVIPPLLLIAIPIGFTKHRRHWITIRGENDYAVLQVSKSIRKLFIPALETYTKVRVEALGDDK